MEQQPSQQTDVTLRIAREDALRMMALLRSALLSPEQCMADDLRTAAGMMKRLSAAVDRLPKEIILALVRKYEPSGILQNMEPLNYVSLSADLNIAIMVADALQDGVLPSPDALIAPMPPHTPESADETDADTATPEAAEAPKAKEAPKAPEVQPAEESSLDLLRLAVKDATAFVPNARIAMLIKLFASKPLLPEVPEDKRAALDALLHKAMDFCQTAQGSVSAAQWNEWVAECKNELNK